MIRFFAFAFFGFFLCGELVQAGTPILVRTAPPSNSIVVTPGDTINFKAKGTDTDGNLSGAEWYGVMAHPVIQYVSEVGGTGSSANFSLSKTFDTPGHYTVSVLAFDTSSSYSRSIDWNIVVDSDITLLNDRAMYVDQFADIVKSPYKQSALLEFSKDNNFTELLLYNLHTVLPRDEAALKTFITTAKRDYGIEQVKAVGGLETDFNRIQQFNDGAATIEKMTGLVLEYEYWNSSPRDIDRYISLLSHMRNIADAQSLTVDTYMGWLTPGSELSDAQRIADLVDIVYLHCYRANAIHTYGYCKGRMDWFLQAKPGIPIRPIFSSEWRPRNICVGNHIPGVGNMCFMGEWLSNNSLDSAESIFVESLKRAMPPSSDNVVIQGFLYFAYTHLAAAIASAPIVEPETPRRLTIKIDRGTRKRFTVAATDWNQNISGVRWYRDNSLQQTQTVAEAGGDRSSALFSRIERFRRVGFVNIRADVFDSTGLIGTINWNVEVTH